MNEEERIQLIRSLWKYAWGLHGARAEEMPQPLTYKRMRLDLLLLLGVPQWLADAIVERDEVE